MLRLDMGVWGSQGGLSDELQEKNIVIPLCLAHCITNNVPIAPREDWDDAILPLGPDWNLHLYGYIDVYVKKVRKSLMQIGEWDREY